MFSPFSWARKEIGDYLVNYRNSQACIPLLLTWLSANMLICFALFKREPTMASPSPCAIAKKKSGNAIWKLQRWVVTEFPGKEPGPLLKDMALLKIQTGNRRD